MTPATGGTSNRSDRETQHPYCVAVIGAGAWGTTVAHLLATGGHRVRIWAHEPEVVGSINQDHRNPWFIPTLHIDDRVVANRELGDWISEADIIILAVPSSHLPGVASRLSRWLPATCTVVNLAKGLAPKTGARLSEILTEILTLAARPGIALAVLSGPNLAGEVAAGRPGAAVVAGAFRDRLMAIQQAFAGSCLRLYRHDDIVGVELGGSFKNVFAIGAGIVDGLGLGDNAKAAFLTRSLREMIRLGCAMGAREQTFWGLSGLGDLLATSNSPLSRNHTLGMQIARGTSPTVWLAGQRSVVEGVPAAVLMRDWARRLKVTAPITEEVCRILFEGQAPHAAVESLMGRALKEEDA